MYLPEILCLKAVALSARMYVLAFQDQHTLTKWNILSNCLLIYQRRENISLWEGVVVLKGQYIHTSRGGNSFWDRIFLANTYIHMSNERTSKPQSHSFTVLIWACLSNCVNQHFCQKPEKLWLVCYENLLKMWHIAVMVKYSSLFQ